MPAALPKRCRKSVMRLSCGICASSHSPLQPAVIRPCSVTAVRFDENKTGAAEREASEMNQVKIIGEAVMRAIHRHRRHHDAVAQRDATKGYRLQQKQCGCGRFDCLNFANRHCSS
jgi:hypothetical protein